MFFRLEKWTEKANCLDADPEAFFPNKGQRNLLTKKICKRCEVIAECLEFALNMPADKDHGIWGGTSEHERRGMRKQRKKV